MDSSSDFRVLEFDTLRPPRPDGEKEALALLKQAAWQVQPIMKRRKWRILLLKELEPENMTRGGDNMNRGEQVRIKVRRPEGGHYSFEHVLNVLLHELCHNEFGPHSASFYKLLDDITVECEELVAKKQGGTGAGFDATGAKLGHRGGWGATPADPKAAAREAALKRAQQHSVMGGGGRLGGASTPAQGLTPQQAAAAAAQRRAAAQRFSREARLEEDEEPQEGGPSAALRRSAAGAGCRLRGSVEAPIVLLDDDDEEDAAAQAEADAEKRRRVVDCVSCRRTGAACACWTCRACTRRNMKSVSVCETCETWRYSDALRSASS